MVVGAAAHELHAAAGEFRCERAGVFDDLLRIRLKVWPEGLAERDRLARDHVHEWATLLAGKHRAVEHLRVLGPAHRDAASRAAERLVRGARDEVGDGHGVVMDAGGDEPGVMGHVDHQLRPDLAGDLCERAVRDLARIRARPGNDQLRLVLTGKLRHLVEVEQVVVAPHAVVHEPVEHARRIELHAVRQVAAMGEVEGEDRVAGLDGRHVDGRIGLAAGVGLHVDMLGPEELLQPLAGEVLDLVDELAAAVIAVAGVALGVFVGEHAADGLHDGRAREVFARDHLQAFGLPGLLRGNRRPDIRVFELYEIGRALRCNAHGDPPESVRNPDAE